jgi:hypothetical protein
MDTVFISYAREDQWHAEKIYMDLRIAEIDAWLDVKCLLPGMTWDNHIEKKIRSCRYFIYLVSPHSNENKRYLMRELEVALEIQSVLPPEQIFIIPVRLEDVTPVPDILNRHNYIDLFKSYEKALGRILTVFGYLEKDPLDLRGYKGYIGKRDAIEFEPFRDWSSFVRDVLKGYPVSSIFINKQHALYFTFSTRHPEIFIPGYLLEKYPQEMTLVLQHRYNDFRLFFTHLTIVLEFNQKTEELTVPYDAITQVVSTMGFKIDRVNF